MDKQSVINQLKSIRDNSLASYELEKELSESEAEDSIWKKDIEAIDAAIVILGKQKPIKFKIRTLDKLLEEIITEYFSDETIEYGYGMWEVIHAVRARYADEIETLPQ